MKSTAFYLKVALIGTGLLVITFLLCDQIYNLVLNKNLFSYSLENSLGITLLILGLMYTTALSIGVWNKWEEFVIICFPFFTSVTIFLVAQNIRYGIIISSVLTLLLGSEVYRSSRLRELLIKDKPLLFLKYTIKRLVLLFSLLAGLIYIFDINAQHEINIGEQVSDITKTLVSKMVDVSIKEGTNKLAIPENMEFVGNFDPSLLDRSYDNVKVSEEEIGDTIEEQVDNLVAPYEKYVKPLISLSKFGIIQFYGIIAYIIYALTIDGIFWIFKKMGLLKVENIPVNKEFLTF